MSFEELWQEHKSFILKLVGGGLVFLVAWLIVTSSFEDTIANKKAAARSAIAKAKRLKLPTGAPNEAKAKLSELQSKLATLEKEFGFASTEGFTLKGVSGASDVHFNQMRQKLSEELVENASSLDIRIDPELGIAGVTPRSDADREWYLNGLDVVRRLCIAGIASGVESVEPIKIQKPVKKKRGAAADSTYMRAVTVSVVAVGSATSLDGMLRALQLPGQRLAVERATMESLDGDRKSEILYGGESLVRLDLRVRGLVLIRDEDFEEGDDA